MRIASVVALLLSFVLVTNASVGFSNCSQHFAAGYQPYEPPGAVQLCRTGAIAISYDTSMVNPAWSAYYVNYDEVTHLISGRDDFYLDPDLKSLGVKQAPVDSDAFNTTWNRGHLCPNHILSYSNWSKKATFSMANVAPQQYYFNQQPWQKLEQKVVDWVAGKSGRALHIITGVAYKSRAKPSRTYDDIAVPDYYFTVLCDVDARTSAGFYSVNTGSGTVTTFYPVSSVEAVYGGALMPPSVCNTATVNSSHWWKF